MGKRVIHSDLEKFLTGRIRSELALITGQPYAGSFVSNAFYAPDPQVPRTPPPFQVIVRDDGGPQTGIVTKAPSVGVTVMGGVDITQGDEATGLALIVCAIVEDCADMEPGNPVAAVTDSNGPYKVPDPSGAARRYMTFTMSVAGKEYP